MVDHPDSDFFFEMHAWNLVSHEAIKGLLNKSVSLGHDSQDI